MKVLRLVILGYIVIIGSWPSRKYSAPVTVYSVVHSTPLASEPTPDSEVIAFIHIGDTLEILEQTEDSYVNVLVNDHLNGWIEIPVLERLSSSK